MTGMELENEVVTLDRYVPLLGAEVEELRALAAPLQGRRVLMVNSTRLGGGVAEMLNRIVPLLGDLGLCPRWETMAGDREFFEVTKAFHNALQGAPVPLPACASPAAMPAEAEAGWWHIFGFLNLDHLREEVKLAESEAAANLTQETQRRALSLKAALNKVMAGEPDGVELAA